MMRKTIANRHCLHLPVSLLLTDHVEVIIAFLFRATFAGKGVRV
jgi:hypothetical protein